MERAIIRKQWIAVLIAVGAVPLAAGAEPPLPPPALLQSPPASPPPPIVPPAPVEMAPLPWAQISPPPVEQKDYFKEALASVYRHQPQLKAQREVVKVADEAVAQAVSGFRPNVSAGYEKGRERVNDSNQQWQYGDTSNKTLLVSQGVFNGGEDWASFKGARERVNAARADLVAMEQQVLFNAVVAYTDVVGKQLVLQLNQSNVDVLHKQLDDTQARFDVGDLTRTDVSQAEARLSQARADERQALGDYETSRVTFRRMMGYDPPEGLELPPLPPGLPENLKEASQWAQAANPALEAARFLETAAGKDVNARAGAVLPDVSINGSMSRSTGVSSLSTSLASRRDNDAITVNVNIPLYQSGAEWSRIREARNLEQQAKFVTVDTRDAVVENVTRAWHDYNTARSVIASTEESAAAAQLALDGVRQENQAGTRTILDVLNAEQEFFGARVNLVTARTLEKTHAYRLLAAVGKLTAQNLGLPVELYDPEKHYDDVKYKLIGF